MMRPSPKYQSLRPERLSIESKEESKNKIVKGIDSFLRESQMKWREGVNQKLRDTTQTFAEHAQKEREEMIELRSFYDFETGEKSSQLPLGLHTSR